MVQSVDEAHRASHGNERREMCYSMCGWHNTSERDLRFRLCGVFFAEKLRWAAMALGTFSSEASDSAICLSIGLSGARPHLDWLLKSFFVPLSIFLASRTLDEQVSNGEAPWV